MQTLDKQECEQKERRAEDWRSDSFHHSVNKDIKLVDEEEIMGKVKSKRRGKELKNN